MLQPLRGTILSSIFLAGAVLLERLLAVIRYPLLPSQLPLSLPLLAGYIGLWSASITLHSRERSRFQEMNNLERRWFVLLTLALLFVSARLYSEGPAQFLLSFGSLWSVICASLIESDCGKRASTR